VGVQRDVPRVAPVQLAVVERGHLAGGRAGLVAAQRLAPDVEHVAQGERAVYRRLDVDDAVSGVRVQPVQAVAAGDERALRRLLALRARNADTRRHLAG
jgi:hypothetical protein